MKAIIELEENEWQKPDHARFSKLFHAFLAIHDPLSHDGDKIKFVRDDGFSLLFDLSVGRVYFGEESMPLDERYFAANIGDGVMCHLLMLFTRGRDAELREFEWDWKPGEAS